ncbi:MAG: hypothetical protein WBE26_13335 [Phycisphaerae bacterium]
MPTILIGIDDTDNESSRGTGHLARQLYKECEKRGLQPFGVTRHQFLLDPRIPYTSHNSGACVAVIAADDAESVAFAFDFVAERAAPGSDPGVCIADTESVLAPVADFAIAATQRVLNIEDALLLGESAGIALRALRKPGQGVIGALGSVGLRASGSEGRFIELPGLRELNGRVDAQAFACLGITLDYRPADHRPSPGDSYDTLDWIRPRLVSGKPVLPVEWSERRDAWVPVDRKRSRPLE